MKEYRFTRIGVYGQRDIYTDGKILWEFYDYDDIMEFKRFDPQKEIMDSSHKLQRVNRQEITGE